MPWGIPVPGDSEHVMYVWFDALVNYVSTLGWPESQKNFEKFWGTVNTPCAIQIAGKDNLRQQSAMWQAMLMSANLPTSRQVLIHGFITSGGQKMSKSIGNVIDPVFLVREYGTDALRYFLSRHVHPFEDSDVTQERFKDSYNADLANGLGNFVARTLTLAEKYLKEPIQVPDVREASHLSGDKFSYIKVYTDAIEKFEFNRAIGILWTRIQELDASISKEQPFKLIKENPELGIKFITILVEELYVIAHYLSPFMPVTSQTIQSAIVMNKNPKILFPRKV